MIKLTLKLGSELIEVIVNGNELLFYDIGTRTFTTIEGLKFSKAGVLKEFPELENNPDWKKIALERLKEHIKSLQTERDKIDYCMKELIKFGYTALFIQRAGFRPEKI